MKLRLWTRVLAWGLLGLTVGVHAQKSVPADYIVALVNSQPVTNAEVRQGVQHATEQLQLEGQPVPAAAALRATVIDRLINEKAMLDYAEQAGIRVDDAAVDQAEQGVARQSQLDVAGLRERLKKEGIDPSTMREQLREQLTLTRLREREVDSRVRVSDQEVEQQIRELQANSNNDPLTQEINLAQILLAVPEKASAEQVAKVLAQATQLKDRAQKGEDFAALVQQYSAGDRSLGGQIGLRRGDRYPQVFVDAIRDLPPGAVSDIVKSGAGFHILKVLERRNPSTYIRTIVQTRARHILLRTGPNLTQAAAVARLNEFKQKIQSGKADFAALAREHSQDASADQGGDLGWIGPGVFVPEFEAVMNRLAEGELSSPVVSRFGVHLIQTQDRRRMDLNPRELRESVRDQLRANRMDETYQSWVKDIRERAYVEVREPAQ